MKIFISYRRDLGIDTAARVATFFKKRKCEVFYDINSMHIGAFDEQIYENIKTSNFVISLLSKGALDRCSNPNDWVRKELECAFENNIPVVPLIMPGFVYPSDLPESISKITFCHGLEYNAVLFDLVMEKLYSLLNDNDVSNTTSTILEHGISLKVRIRHCCKAEMSFLFDGEPCPEEYRGKVGFKEFYSKKDVEDYWIPCVEVSIYNLSEQPIILGERSPEIHGEIKLPGGQKISAMSTRMVMDPSQEMGPRIINSGQNIKDVLVGTTGIMAVQPFIAKSGSFILDVNDETVEIPLTTYKEAIDYAENIVSHDIDDLFMKAQRYFYYR